MPSPSTAKARPCPSPTLPTPLPCYYAVTGSKVGTLGELKQALGVVKTLMTRNPRLNDAFMSGRGHRTVRRVHRRS